MAVLEGTDSLLVLVFDLAKGLVPALVKVLIFHEVSILDLLSFAGLLVDELLSAAGEILYPKLLNAVLCHLSLDVLALGLALLAVLLQYGTKTNMSIGKF